MIEMNHYPVSAWQEGGEIRSNGLAFEDYARCQTITHKGAPYRKLETPSWAVNDAEFRELLLNFLEERACIRPWLRAGTPKERLERAQKIIIARAQKLIPTMDRLCREYVELKRVAITPEQHKRLRKLEEQIENLDTRLRFEAKDGGAALVTGVVYDYFRLGSDSVATAEAVGAKPPHVRQVIWRLRETAKTLEKWRRDPSTRPQAPQSTPKKPRLRKAKMEKHPSPTRRQVAA